MKISPYLLSQDELSVVGYQARSHSTGDFASNTLMGFVDNIVQDVGNAANAVGNAVGNAADAVQNVVNQQLDNAIAQETREMAIDQAALDQLANIVGANDADNADGGGGADGYGVAMRIDDDNLSGRRVLALGDLINLRRQIAENQRQAK